MVTEKICNKDIGKYDDGEIRVYGTWGMGGVGKTTLAQLVYNHERVKKDFQLRCWVHVSEKFQVKEIIRKIIEFIDKCGCTLTELSALQDTLQSKLRGNKFLIVLDDVWIEENEKDKWEELSKTLSCGALGSTIVMTTRSNITSRMMAKVGELQHEVECLSEEDSWLLFKKFAFAKGREGGDISEVEFIGKEIVEKCRGLPLAVKTLGSLMWSKRSTSDWQRVKGSNIWELQENKVLPALKLSYDNLAPYLKRCFAYCCLFPKGYDMEMAVVIPLWVSNGFIPPREGKDLYVIGEEIFNCLVWRSFFQVDKDFKYTFKMHDLMHDMALHVMRHDCLVIEPACKEAIIPNEVLHLSSSYPDEKFNFSSEDLEKFTSLRSIFMFEELAISYSCYMSKPQYKFSQIFNQQYLRVLYLAS
ncbi:putative P-loop containing nucleoside triphosphate hydrolase [Helianthus debilis subsp. tardiflorus]